MPPIFVLPLDSHELTLQLGGGKASALSRLLRAGFRVPKGFVVTTEAYRHFVSGNRLDLVIDAIWARIDPTNLATLEAASRQIRSLFGQTRLPPELANPIRSIYNERVTVEETVAVRASAYVDTLADRSFAGLHETYLSVIGEQAILDSVVRCWSSLWSTRAIAYRMQHGIAPAQVSMGVIVQLMIPARMSGGLFTVNPISGDPTQMIINSVLGLSTMLTDGQGTPDTFVVDSETGEIIDSKIAHKALMITLESGQLREAYVDSAERGKPSLSELHVSAVVALGRQLAKAFGGPQDVQWAILNSRLYILQVRPITGNTGYLAMRAPGNDAWLPQTEQASQPYDLWTLSETGERWPEPVTPFTWSIWAPILQRNTQSTFADLKADLTRDVEWIKRLYGRIYTNEGALAHILYQGYGVPATILADGVGGLPEVAKRYHDWRWVTLIQRSPLILRQMRNWDEQIKRFEHDFEQIERWVAAFMDRDLHAESDQSLWDQAQGIWLQRLETYTGFHTSATSSAMYEYGEMEKQLEHWGEPALIQPLVTGLSGIIQTEILADLWSLTHLIKRQKLDSFFLSSPPSTVLRELPNQAEASQVLAQLQRFLQRHGHRSAVDAEWLYPRWVEEPANVIEQIVNYLRSGSGFNPHEAEQHQQQERFDATQRLESRLNPLQRISFRRSLSQLHRLVRVRDNGQHYLSMLLLPPRRIYATLAARWAARGWLAQADDFYFLVVPEIEALLKEGEPAVSRLDLPHVITERRSAWRYWHERPDPPAAISAEGKPLSLIGTITEGQLLDGVAASGGWVTGRARVVLSLKAAAGLEAGDILVTRALDPSWTPLFSIISGIVLETGGQLSQSAIVAREYGLPAVIGVYGATRRVPEGQQITVDGVAGKVYWK